MEQAPDSQTGTYIQIDGKTLKGNGIADKKGRPLVSAYAHRAFVAYHEIKEYFQMPEVKKELQHIQSFDLGHSITETRKYNLIWNG